MLEHASIAHARQAIHKQLVNLSEREEFLTSQEAFHRFLAKVALR